EVSLCNFCHLSRGNNWISKLQKYWNAVSHFAQKTIEDSKKKGKDIPKKSVTEFIIEIAHHSFEIHDFQTASALTLGISGCRKLPKISKHSQLKLDTLKDKFSLAFNNENLRNEIKTLEMHNLIYVPYLPLISKEIELIHHGNPDVIDFKINEEKLKLLNRVFEHFLNIQSRIVEKNIARTDILFELRDSELS
ncbi:MAG: RasGEF domain-containing protein, partial [Parachlamydiaceae bacterium]